MIVEILNLHVPWQFDLESIFHQTSPIAIFEGQNLMGVLQMDELFHKLNTKGELEFQNHILLQLWRFLFSHNYSKF